MTTEELEHLFRALVPYYNELDQKYHSLMLAGVGGPPVSRLLDDMRLVQSLLVQLRESIPSRQMFTQRINLNDMVKFKMTAEGRRAMSSAENQQNALIGVQKDGTSKIPLHVFIAMFGKFLYVGGPTLIEQNTLELERTE